ncbi:MAG: phosphotransferase [Actinomycetes bacterium]
MSQQLRGLCALLCEHGPTDTATLEGLLRRQTNGDGQAVAVTELRRGVYRLRFGTGRHDSLVVKRLSGPKASLERRITDRWLPAAGLHGCGPPRVAAAGERGGRHVWHVYADLGEHSLDQPDVDRDRVEAAMSGVAEMHSRFAFHALLPEARFSCGDLGAYFYSRSVRDAIRTLERLGQPMLDPSPERAGIRDGLLELLQQLLDDEVDRVRLMAETAGPETLLHGDLTPANVFVLPSSRNGGRLRLIDWDHAGVGPAAFDISTQLSYVPPRDRELVLGYYLHAMAERGCPYDACIDWDVVLKTMEAGRLANQVIWLGIQARSGHAWSFAGLEERRRLLAVLLGHRLPGGVDAGRAYGFGSGPWNQVAADGGNDT